MQLYQSFKKEHPKVTYHLIGKPTLGNQLKSQATDLDVDKEVVVHGILPGTELLSRLAGSSIKLMLSNHTQCGDFEGFGIAILEANAFGVPAVGSRDSGIADAIDDHKTGILVDPKNKIEIAAAVKEIMQNYSYFLTMQKNGH